MWDEDEIQSIDMTLNDGVLTGSVRLRNGRGNRSYEAALYGVVESKDGKVVRFDLVSKGLFEGAGRYTLEPPPGKFPFAVSFTLADGSDVADAIPPQGSRGWIEGYLQ